MKMRLPAARRANDSHGVKRFSVRIAREVRVDDVNSVNIPCDVYAVNIDLVSHEDPPSPTLPPRRPAPGAGRCGNRAASEKRPGRVDTAGRCSSRGREPGSPLPSLQG